MPAAAVNRVESRRKSNDCAIWALSIYLGIAYENVYEKTVKLEGPRVLEGGLYTPAIQRVAKALGHRLTLRKRPDLSEEYGLLLVSDHVVMLRNGLVLDTDATVWDVDAWLHHHKYSVYGLLVDQEK
jgi:hypothetical protein